MSATAHPPIPEPSPGDGVSAAWARAIVRTLRSMRLSAGPGARVQTTPAGTTVSLAGGGDAPGGQEVCIATLGEISGRAVAAPARPLSSRNGAGARTVEVWALDLADESALLGRYEVVAFPVARLEAKAATPEEEGG